MDNEQKKERETEAAASPSSPDKRTAYRERIQRTVIACLMGVFAGILSFTLAGSVDPITGIQSNAVIGMLVLLAGIVLQKYLFMIVRIDFTELAAKDWFYQAFMTFALWFISWTLLLSAATAV
jgi:hypothetical protein